jgi:ABC-type Fe3+ transport system permease subunit
MDSTPGANDPEAILQTEINRYLQVGYQVTSQTSRSAELVKPKKFNIILAIICFTLAILPLVIYLLYYAFKWDDRVQLTVDEEGHVTRTRGLGGQVPGAPAA